MVTMSLPSRRGVLLLVVLSVLTLFLMLGTAYLAVATRARKAARAFADNVVSATATSVSQVRLLDEAFWAVARGTLATGTGGAAIDYLGTGVGAGEDLLGDKYGSATVIGKVTAAARVASSPAVLELTCTAISGAPTNVSDYAGRVVSLLLPGLSASTRILGASGSPAAPTLFVPGGPTVTGEVLSDSRINAAIAKAGASASNTLVVNGREFDDSGTNEPYDGYDSANPLLTRLALSGGVLSTGTAVIYTTSTATTPTPLTFIDNDGDGQPESGFIDIGLPPLLDANGQTLYPQAAILVIDLDGRLNVNAHGGATDAQTVNQYPTLNPTPPNGVMRINRNTVPLYQLPRGATPGPPDVSLSRSLVFADAAAPPTSDAAMVSAATFSLAGRIISGTVNMASDKATSREVPKVGQIEGKFGDGVTSGSLTPAVGTGFPNTNDVVSRKSDQWRATVDTSGTAYVSKKFFEAPGRYGSPWDVKGRMRLWVDDFGQPVYFKPSWATAGTSDDDVVDDPYELNLTRLGSRAAYGRSPSGAAPADNIFTPAELEGLMRYFDPDSMKLPRRLVAMNERNASSNRLLLTTESWDTPAIVGNAWRTVVGGTTFATLLSASGLTPPNRAQDFFSAETIMGHRFDINRPFHDSSFDEPNDATGTARRQMFARHLYCLMVAIAHKNDPTITATPSRRNDIARQIAQYAINIVDYRDGDSVMTQFKYDPTFTLGSSTWAPGTDDYVWGCERPELLITETLAWHDRCTDDTASDPTGQRVIEIDSNGDGITDADDDFDQQRRPRGAFFVELYSPWRGRTAVYDTVSGSSIIRSGSNTLGEPISAAFRTSGTAGFDASQTTTSGTVLDSTITLNKTVSGCPVWRLVSVRGDVQGGSAFDGTTKNIVDPSAPGSTAIVDRVFYFGNLTATGTALKNPTDAKDGKPGAVFWTTGSSALEPSQAQYVVVGTHGLGFDYRTKPFTGTDVASGTSVGLSYANTIHLGFDGPSTSTTLRPATLSEPINTLTSGSVPNRDPYELLSSGSFGPSAGVTPSNLYDQKTEFTNPLDKPLDEILTGPTGPVSESFRMSNAAMVAADPAVAGKPLLMFNGTHENFAVLHLQRLADPTKVWNASTNPYVTVDSMPVDLTVVNTDQSRTKNFDEPGKTPYDITANTPGPAALKWLQTRKNYRYQSVERGGKSLGSPNTERDIWNRRVSATAAALSSGTTLASGTTVISGTSPYASSPVSAAPRVDPPDPMPVTPLNLLKTPPLPAEVKQITPATTTLTGTTDHTLREYAAQTEIQSRPARFAKTPGPLFPWLAWPNRPFGTTVDLALVPATSPFELTGRHSTAVFKAPTPNFFHLPRFFESATPESPWDAISGRTAATHPSLFDFVHIPSSYAAVYTSVTPTLSGSAALKTLGLDIFPLNQISNFREPGRVNVNTIPDRKVWRALFGAARVLGVAGDPNNPDDPNTTSPTEQPAQDRIPGWTVDLFSKVVSGTVASGTTPVTSGSNSPTRVPTVTDFFRFLPDRNTAQRQSTPAPGGFIDRFVKELNEDDNFNGTLDAGEDDNGNGTLDQNDANANGVYDINEYRNSDLNAYFRYQTMRQLSNIVTTRSNVFGVWITLRYVDSSGVEVTPIQRNRAFFIFDRSIPVAYEKGKNHNLQDAILLRRIIQ